MLLKLDSLVQVAYFSFFFGCPSCFGAFEQLTTRCPVCFGAFEQFTTLKYINAYFLCVYVACEYFLFAFRRPLGTQRNIYAFRRPLGTQKNICAFHRPLGSIRLSFWQEDFMDLEKYLCFSSSIGDLEKYLPNYEFCRFLLVDDPPSSLGSICDLVVFCWDDVHPFKESYCLFLGRCTSFKESYYLFWDDIHPFKESYRLFWDNVHPF